MYYYHRKIPAHSTSIGIVNLHMFYRARRYFMKYDYSSYATCSATCMITKFYFFLFFNVISYKFVISPLKFILLYTPWYNFVNIWIKKIYRTRYTQGARGWYRCRHRNRYRHQNISYTFTRTLSRQV